MNYDRYLRSLELAEMQFKLAIHACSAAHSGNMSQNCIGFIWGELSVSGDYLKLDGDELATAGSVLQHSATYLLAVSIDTALDKAFPDHLDHHTPDVAIAARIARNLRNAFAHDPLFPEWRIKTRKHVGRFSLPDVIELDTTNLDGEQVEQEHYGGPLALLRLLNHARSLLQALANAE